MLQHNIQADREGIPPGHLQMLNTFIRHSTAPLQLHLDQAGATPIECSHPAVCDRASLDAKLLESSTPLRQANDLGIPYSLAATKRKTLQCAAVLTKHPETLHGGVDPYQDKLLKVRASSSNSHEAAITDPVCAPAIDMQLAQFVAVLRNTDDASIGAFRGLDKEQHLQIRTGRDSSQTTVTDLELLKVNLDEARSTGGNDLQWQVPGTGAPQDLERAEIGRGRDERHKAEGAVQILEADRAQRHGLREEDVLGDGGGGDGARSVREAAEALDGEVLEEGAGLEHGDEGLGPEGAGGDGELAEHGGRGGEGGEAGVGELPEAPELEPGEAVGGQRGGDGGGPTVVEAVGAGAARAAEGELGDGGEAGEDGGGVVAEHGARVEGEAVARGGVDLLPARAGEGAGVALGRGERGEDEREDLVGEVLRVVARRRGRREGGWVEAAAPRARGHRRRHGGGGGGGRGGGGGFGGVGGGGGLAHARRAPPGCVGRRCPCGWMGGRREGWICLPACLPICSGAAAAAAVGSGGEGMTPLVV
uniref:Uncharacterized protein n=1 Tax=Triticum urartu TaxID=4572 RepID=A0A8R7PHR9_TRIUA